MNHGFVLYVPFLQLLALYGKLDWPHPFPSHLSAPTHTVTLSHSENKIVELHCQLCNAYPGIPSLAFPI
jgi:hypothetical protein